MGKSWFIWNDIDCRSMGIVQADAVPIVRGEERVQHVTIPGRAGELTLTEGADIYQSYIQTVSLSVIGGYRVRDVYDWLRGSGFVTFSGEPDRKQKARVIGAITLEKISKNMDAWRGEVQFYCEPLKMLLTAKSTSVSNGSTVINTGDVVERPAISFKAGSTSATIGCGGKTLTMTGLTANNVYLIDSDAEIFTYRDTNMTANTSGGFPVLNVGSNTFSCTNASAVTIYRREKFL